MCGNYCYGSNLISPHLPIVQSTIICIYIYIYIYICVCVCVYTVPGTMAPFMLCTMGFLPNTQYCGMRKRRKCRERFPRHSGLAIPTCITAHAWSLTSGFLWSCWRGKRSRHSRWMRIPQFSVSGKRRIADMQRHLAACSRRDGHVT